MTPERWSRVKEVLGAVLEREPADRGGFLASACGTDEDLRREVEHLLISHEQAPPFLERPAGEHMPILAPMIEPKDGMPLERIGPFRILDVLGEGGMGTVYLAEQDSPRRTVALKVIRGATSEDNIRRFEIEAAALARLQHPGIAQIYQAGVTGEGRGRRPYFAMELVRGSPLTEHARRLGLRARIELIVRVAEAVQHAHVKGVVHRDLKPGNILVDEAGTPKILDFGVARLTDSDARATTVAPGAGALVGTVPYMSPEQVGGDPGSVDTRSDVYSLGVMLFEVLTGRLPYDVEKRSVPEAVRMIQETPPARLSTVVRALRGDLDTIVSKALEKDRHRRYQSASDLAADLRRFVAREPILARPASALYHLRKFAARNRSVVFAAAVVILALLGGVIGVTVQRDRALEAAHRASIAEARAVERFKGAWSVIGGMFEFTEHELAGVPGGTRARLRLAEQALPHLRGLVADDAEGRARQTAAYGYQRLGEVRLVMGHVSEARDWFRQSVTLRQESVAEEPTSDARRSLAVGRWKQFEADLASGRTGDAIENARAAMILVFEAAGVAPARTPRELGSPAEVSEVWLPYIGIAARRFGEALAAAERWGEALSCFAAAAAHFRESITRSAGTPYPAIHDRGLAQALIGLGEALAANAEPERALAACDGAGAAIAAALTKDGSTHVLDRIEEARLATARSRILATLGRTEEAIASAATAIEHASALCAADPLHAECQLVLAEALMQRARLLHSGPDPGAALDSIRHAVLLLEPMVDLDPEYARPRLRLAELAALRASIVSEGGGLSDLARRCDALEAEGRFPEAVAAIRRRAHDAEPR